MKNKKNIIPILVLAIIIVISVLLCIFINKKNSIDKELSNGENKVIKLYSKLIEENNYIYEKSLDNDNYLRISKSGKNAYVENNSYGILSKYIIRDEKMYFEREEENKYYVFEDNTLYLGKATQYLKELTDLGEGYTSASEKIDNKMYYYQEYKGTTYFINQQIETNEEYSSQKVKLYFENDDLKYIKSSAGEKEELVKINIAYENIDAKLFELNSNYRQE